MIKGTIHQQDVNIPCNTASKIHRKVGHWWLTPVILATQEAEIRRITVQKLAWENSSVRSHLKKPFTKKKKKKGVVGWLKV
jgi:hypothetical protein